MTSPLALSASTLGPLLPFPLNAPQRAQFQALFNALPGVVYQGVRVDLSHDEMAQLFLDEVKPHHLGGMGVGAVNGACLSAAMDGLLGVAGVLHLGAWADGRKSGTVELSIQIVRSVYGNSFTARAGVTKATNELAFARGEILDEKGRICVTATGIIAASSSSRD